MQTIAVVAPSVIALGQAPVVISAIASSGLPVTVISNTPGVCSVTGSGPFTVTPLAPGLYTLTTSQSGDAGNAPVSVTITL